MIQPRQIERVLIVGAWPDRSEHALIGGLARHGVKPFVAASSAFFRQVQLPQSCSAYPLEFADSAAPEKLRSIIQEVQPDALHLLTSTGLSVLRRGKGQAPRPPILFYRGRVEQPRWWIPRDRRKYLGKSVDLFLANSTAVGDALVAGGVPADRVWVIRKGHDAAWYDVPPHDLRSELGISRDTFVVGLVANLRAEKGSHLILPTAELVGGLGTRIAWVLVGDDKRSPWARWAHPFFRPGIFPLGFRSDVPALLPTFDCLVCPSLTEGMPRAVVEAMFRGVPVVATAVGGVPEMIRDEQSGLLVAPNATALAAAIRRLAGDVELRTRLAQSARAWVSEHLSIDGMVERTLAAYGAALDLHASRR